MPNSRVPLWAWWVGLVFVLSMPWPGFTREPQWRRLNLVPFSDPTDKPRDFILNTGLFIPFGFSFFKNYRGRSRLLTTVAAGALDSGAPVTVVLMKMLPRPYGFFLIDPL